MKIYDKTTQTYKELVLKPGGDTLPIGSIVAFSGENIPNGWLLCDGSVVSRTTYSELFNAIGLNYVEDGVEWLDEERFPLPNAKGRTLVGKDSTDTDFNTLGKTSGEKTHTLTVDEMPSHKHSMNFGDSAGGDGSGFVYSSTSGNNNVFMLETGGGQAHNNLQPSLTLNFIIKAKNTVAIKGDVIQETGTASETNVYSSVAIDNKIQALKSKNIIVVGYSRHTQSLTSWTNTLITDASVKTQIGNKLTFSNNKVIIGEGVSHIRISAKSSFKKTVTGDCSINVKKNDESITILDTYENVPSNSWHNTAISPSIIEVSQGDEISLNITLGNSGDVEFLAASYITIEEV
jgi:microcystin-dependent protein